MNTEAAKALIIGPEFFGYNESIARALESLGWSVSIITSPTHTPKGVMNRILIDGAGALGIKRYALRWQARFNRQILDVGRAHKPDLLLVIKGDWVTPETFAAIPAAKKVIWFQDSALRSGKGHCDLARIADATFVFEGNDVDYLRQAGVSNVTFLAMGYDPAVYRDLAVTDKNIDICFVGRMYEERKQIVNGLVRDFPDRSIEIWGRYVRYREPRTWLLWLVRQCDKRLRTTYRNRNIPPDAVNALYNHSKIVLNIHHRQSQNGFNPRTVEITGAGAFQICDANAYVASIFDGSVVQFADYDDLKSKLHRYLDDADARNDVVNRARPIAAAHNFEARMRTVLKTLENV